MLAVLWSPPVPFMWFFFFFLSTVSENLQGKKLVRNFQNAEARHAKGKGISPTVQRHSSGAKGMRMSAGAHPAVSNWICYFVWVTTLRNATGFFHSVKLHFQQGLQTELTDCGQNR